MWATVPNRSCFPSRRKFISPTVTFCLYKLLFFYRRIHPLKAFSASMPLRIVIDRFLIEVREEENLAFNQRPSSQRMENEGSSGSNFPPPVPDAYMRRLEDRVEQLESRIPSLTQEINSLRRWLASITAKRDRLQAEVNRLRRRR